MRRSVDPSSVPTAEVHRYLLACVAPRPIAFVGTQDADGRENLAPFSFFNAFGANPPVVAFSPAFRGLDGTSKHTFDNVLETGEFTVSTVSYDMVHRMSYASADWPVDVEEFDAVGFRRSPSTLVSPPGVAESPMFMECRLMKHVPLGNGPGSGQLLIGEVVMFHFHESIFDGPYPDYRSMDLVARMGGPNYARANGDAVFSIPKPGKPGGFIDELPPAIRNSPILTGEDLAQLASVLPAAGIDSIERADIETESLEAELRFGQPARIIEAWMRAIDDGDVLESATTHQMVRRLLVSGNKEIALALLVASETPL